MKRTLLSAAILFVLLGCAHWAGAQTIPPVKGKALDDSEVVLPKPGSQQLLILVVGFSQKSGDFCAAWGKRLALDYPADSRVAVYQLPELQSAPSLVRGLIVHGMRKGVPPAQHSHFVPLYDHEDDWKKTVNFSAPNDPYIVVAAPDGHVLWQTHGPVSDSGYAQLKSAVAKLLADSPKQ